MRRAFIDTRAAILVLFLSIGSLDVPASETEFQMQWLLVTAPAFRAALEPLIAHRRAEGFKLVILETTNALTTEQICKGDAGPLQSRISELVRGHPGPSYLLLAGTFGAKDPVTAAATVVPTQSGTIARMKGKPSDFPYCQPNAAGSPSVAVGRFPARTVEEIQGMVQKTLAFEQNQHPGQWQHRLVFLDGNPGGGALAEMFVESAIEPKLAQLNPAWTLRALVHIPASPYFLPTSQLHDAA